MVVCGTNHYGKDRPSFSTYIDLPYEIGSCTVLGVGTVELEMVRGSTDPRTYKLVLENVLHTHRAPYNGVSISPPYVDGLVLMEFGRISVFSLTHEPLV